MTTHVSCFTTHGYLKHLLLRFRKFACCLQKKLDISFLVTRIQMIFGEKEQSVKA